MVDISITSRSIEVEDRATLGGVNVRGLRDLGCRIIQ